MRGSLYPNAHYELYLSYNLEYLYWSHPSKLKIKKEVERKALYKAKKPQEKQPTTETKSPSNTAYKTNSCNGKALARVKQSFSKSPWKRRAVVKQFAWERIKVKLCTSINDTHIEELALHWIQYKNSLKYKFGCFWQFSYVYAIN